MTRRRTQDRGVAELQIMGKIARKGRYNMNTRTYPGMWLAGMMALCLLLGTTLSAVAHADGDSDGDSDNRSKSHKTLEGTWRTTEDVPDLGLFGLPGLFTFSAGANSPRDGTVVHSDPGFVTPTTTCLPLQGVWQRTGKRRFIGSDEGFCNSSEFPLGMIRTKFLIRLDRSGNEFDADYLVELIDVDGNSFFPPGFAGTLHGVRMQAEAP